MEKNIKSGHNDCPNKNENLFLPDKIKKIREKIKKIKNNHKKIVMKIVLIIPLLKKKQKIKIKSRLQSFKLILKS